MKRTAIYTQVIIYNPRIYKVTNVHYKLADYNWLAVDDSGIIRIYKNRPEYNKGRGTWNDPVAAAVTIGYHVNSTEYIRPVEITS